MNDGKTKPGNIDEYITGFPEDIQKILESLRSTIKKTAPAVEEKISYAMPAFHMHGRPLVYFAAFKNHIGFYPVPSAIKAFKKELSAYKMGKGSIQFPLDQPMPLDLVSRIVMFRIKENRDKAPGKRSGGRGAEQGPGDE